MNNYSLKVSITKNQLDDLTDGLVNAMRYVDNKVTYPNIEDAKPNDGVEPEWFYPIYNGINNFSELNAIHVYTSNETQHEEIGELMLGIGMTEMKHFGKLGELIKALGGEINQQYDNRYAEIGDDVASALNIAIDGELSTINFYDSMIAKVEKLKQTDTTKIVLQLVSKLRADEQVHLHLLTNKQKSL